MADEDEKSNESGLGSAKEDQGAFAAAPTAKSMPAWLSSDWLFAVVACLGAFFVLVVLSALIGMLNTFVLTGSASSVVQGAITGLFLAFSSFGVEAGASSSTDDIIVAYGTRYLPILWFALFVAVIWMAVRYCHSRSESSVVNRRALVVKLALVFGVLASIAAALLTFGDSAVRSDGLVSTVDSGTAFLYGFFFTLVVTSAFHQRNGVQLVVVPDRLVQNRAVRRGGADLFQGVKTYVIVLAALAVFAIASGFIIADTMRDRVLLVTGFPFHLGNVGASAETLAMGGAVEFAGNPDGHVSLMNWAWGDAVGERAPLYFFILLLVTPAMIFWRTTNYLDERGAHDEADLLGAGIRFATGFTLTSWVFSGLGRVNFEAFGINSADPIDGDFNPIKVFEFAPSPRAAFGLALLWSLAGSLAAALLWGQRRGLQLFSSLGSVAASSEGEPDGSTTF